MKTRRLLLQLGGFVWSVVLCLCRYGPDATTPPTLVIRMTSQRIAIYRPTGEETGRVVIWRAFYGSVHRLSTN